MDSDGASIMTKATAKANPNIALVKYWGKRDEELILPLAGSLSLTLDILPTTTTVSLQPGAEHDTFRLNGNDKTDTSASRVTRFLDLVREIAGSNEHAHVESTNDAPTGAGLASSASGFAALALAASKAYGLDLDAKDLSRLARRGSGSASRSIIPNIAVWREGDDESSFAESVEAPELRMAIVTLDSGQKAVSSREAMRRTRLTSPFHEAWITSTRASLEEMIAVCASGDIERIGQITESHALRMHAVIQSTEPPIRYLSGRSIDVFDAVKGLRDSGAYAYATADAGPNVAVLSTPQDIDAVARSLSNFGDVRVAAPGLGARLVEENA